MPENTDVVISELNKLLKKELIDFIMYGLLPDNATNPVLVVFAEEFSEKINRRVRVGEESEGKADADNSKLMQIEIQYLKELQTQKDLIIENQAIAIETLKNHNDLLMNKNPADIVSQKRSKSENQQQKNSRNNNKNDNKQKQTPIVREGNSVSDAPVSYASTVTANQNTIKSAQVLSSQGMKISPPGTLRETAERGQSSKSGNYEWTEVTHTKPKRRSSRTLVVGNFSGSSNVQGIDKMKFLHVSNLKPSTTADDLFTFLTRNFSNNIKCEPLKARYPESYASFKVEIPTSEYDKALVASNWPNRANVRPFYQRRLTDQPR